MIYLHIIPATECRTFLLYYLPILCGILPDKYLAHALLLSKAIRLLLGDQVSLADIDISENLLMLFWRLTEEYYGQRLSISIVDATYGTTDVHCIITCRPEALQD